MAVVLLRCLPVLPSEESPVPPLSAIFPPIYAHLNVPDAVSSPAPLSPLSVTWRVSPKGARTTSCITESSSPFRCIVEEAGVPKAAIVDEARGLWEGDVTLPSDLVVLDFTTLGRHLILDGVITTTYRNSIMTKVATVPGFAAKKVEDAKFKSHQTSAHPVSEAHGGRNMFVPFAMEDGDMIGSY